MRSFHRLGLGVALVAAVLFASPPARADTALFWSMPGETFGWAAGYPPAIAESEAERFCKETGATECRQVLACPGGWGAVAYAVEPEHGVAAVCGLASAEAASTWAFSSCIVVSGVVCKLDAVFYDSGRSVERHDDPDAARLRLVQWMLSVRYDVGAVDGAMSPKTRDAIKTAQGAFGLPVTGQVDDALIERAIEMVGGIRAVADEFRFTHDKQRKDHPLPAGYEFSWGPNPPKPLYTSERLASTQDTAKQMHILAKAVIRLGAECPAGYANSGAPVPERGPNVWRVDCAEHTYYLEVGADGADKLLP